MDIRIRAALEVAGGLCLALVAGSALFAILNLIEKQFGTEGVLILVAVFVIGALGNLIYQIRVSQLRVLERLKK